MKSSDSPPPISIIIRNRNEGDYLKPVLESIRQQLDVETEVILVDNESTDESLTVAEEFGCRVVTLARDSFTYGRAINIGLEVARSEICVLLSAHSMLVGPYALRSCVAAFDDPKVAAARFLHAGKRFDIRRWINPERISATSDFNLVNSRGPLANGCALRRSVWEKIKFNETLHAAEDKIWAFDVIRKGFSIISPVATTYCYLKTLSERDRIRKNNVELLAIFSATGVRYGPLREGIVEKVRRFFPQLALAPFKAAYGTLMRMYLDASLLLTLYRQNQRK